MGTTLTGTTPQDTYDSLIKVTDNGPIGATAKYLSDGLGNDSVLALSTSKVGIGTTSPNSKFDIVQTSNAEAFRVEGAAGGFAFLVDGGTSYKTIIRNASIGNSYGGTAAPSDGLIVEGNVGIGTSAPAVKLEVSGGDVRITSASAPRLSLNNTSGSGLNYSLFSNDIGKLVIGRTGITDDLIVTSAGPVELVYGQLKFPATQVASADANTLDDYEEGTFNYSITFGGGSTGITYNHRGGTYTKIGNKVTVNGLISLSNKGSDTGDARITGLPFTIPNAVANYTAPSFQLFNITFANQVFGYAVINTNQISMNEMTEAGVVTTLTNADFANNSEVIIGLTYFV